MERRERYEDSDVFFRRVQESVKLKTWTAIPGIIDSFNANAMTCNVKPSVSVGRRLENGEIDQEEIPILLDCPVNFPGGGGCTLTFPIKPGDECLVVFSSRCIDAWFRFGGVQKRHLKRAMSLADGFVIPGVRSLPRAFTVSTSAAQLRTDDGSAYVEINPESRKIKALTSGDIEAQASGNIVLDAPNITLKGNIVLDGPITQANTTGGGATATMIGPLNVTNDVTAGGKSLINHVHSGVQSGGSNTGKPV